MTQHIDSTSLPQDRGKSIIMTIKQYYRSGESDLGQDFFVPCLSFCSSYKRAVGYFSSSALITWAAVLPRIISKDQTLIYLLISPSLNEDDLHALKGTITTQERDSIYQKKADNILLDALEVEDLSSDKQLRIKLLTWMIRTQKLELRFAFPNHVENPVIFHEKIGIFEFPWKEKIAFTGSANESTLGHTRNYESIDVFRSWVGEDEDRVQIKIDQFTEAWEGRAKGLKILPLSEETLELVKSRAPKENPDVQKVIDSPKTNQLDKWRHQDEAINAFLNSEKGILEMATGTGKTRTALRIFEQLVYDGKISTLIVTADGTDLHNQWYKQLIEVSDRFNEKFVILRHFERHHERDEFILNPNLKILLISRSALAPALRKLNDQAGARTFLIHDEVHRLGSPGNRRDLAGLSDKIRFRLGLSATPERE